MKNTKKLFYAYALFGMAFMAVSCNDDFTEEDMFNRLESQEAANDAKEAAEEAANAAALAGVNLDYKVTVHSNETVLAGVEVTITGSGESIGLTTDASGTVSFAEIPLGAHTVTISSVDHLDVSYQVDFGSPEEGTHYEIIDEKVFNLNTLESSKIPLLEQSGMQTATVKGRVEIELDLTNRVAEIPQGITVRANLDGNGLEGSHSENSSDNSSIYVEGSFSFAQGDIGSAIVDGTTGEYSMTVPATAAGTEIELLLPLVEADQTLAFSEVNGVDVGIQVGAQLAYFGWDITATATPKIEGVSAEFPTPAPAGRGFSVTNFTPLPGRLIKGGKQIFFPLSINDFPVEPGFSNILFRGEQGAGYQSTPLVTVDPPALGDEGTTAEIVARMIWEFESVTVTGQNFPYDANEIVVIGVDVEDENGDIINYPLGPVNADGNGQLPSEAIDLDINVLFTNYIAKGFTVTFDGDINNIPTLGTLVYSGSVNEFRIWDDGNGYTSIPNITIEDIVNTSPATLEITDMAFSYTFDLDNSGVTSGYVILPEIDFVYGNTPNSMSSANDEEVIVDLVILNENGLVLDNVVIESLEEGLIVSGGDLLFDNDNYFGVTDVDKARLNAFSYTVPSIVVTEPIHIQTTANVDINDDGEVTGLSDIKAGSGYTEEYGVTLSVPSGLSGTGAAIQLTGFSTDSQSGEVDWSESNVLTTQGSGYTTDVNINEEFFNGETTNSRVIFKVKNGETKLVNINYGTGAPLNELDEVIPEVIEEEEEEGKIPPDL